MRGVLPGRPEPTLQALSTGFWNSVNIVVYITGNAIVILAGVNTLLQTIYHDEDRKFETVAFDPLSGKIAVCSDRLLSVHKPSRCDGGTPKWSLQSTFEVPEKSPSLPSVLSWGASEELLLGTLSLTLYGTKTEISCLWKKELAAATRRAVFASDSCYLASVGHVDCLVKIWRRLNFGADEVNFSLSYLRHPKPVTDLRWRGSAATNFRVLYTSSSDHTFRVWTQADADTGEDLALVHCIHVASCSGISSLSDWSPVLPLASILDGRDLAATIQDAIKQNHADLTKLPFPDLCAIGEANQDICLLFDGKRNALAWSLDLASLSAQTTECGSVPLCAISPIDLSQRSSATALAAPHVDIRSYYDRSSGQLCILLHALGEGIEVYSVDFVDFFGPLVGPKYPLSPKTTLTGHCEAILGVTRNCDGDAIVSRTVHGETALWKHDPLSVNQPLSRQSVLPKGQLIDHICLLRHGLYVLVLGRDDLSLWDCRHNPATAISSRRSALSGDPLCLVELPHPIPDNSIAFVATVASNYSGVIWRVTVAQDPSSENLPSDSIHEYHRCQLPGCHTDKLTFVLPVDPAGASQTTSSGFLDIFAKDLIVTYSQPGRVQFWTTRIDTELECAVWLSTSWVDTEIADAAKVGGSILKKCALIHGCRSRLTIWDVGSARLELSQEFPSGKKALDLDWTSTPGRQSILAVVFQQRVMLLSQMRYDYLNKDPAWASICEIDLQTFTPHPIGDAIWLSAGHLIIGAGNQFFLHGRRFKSSSNALGTHNLRRTVTGTWDLFDAVQRLNGPLPVFHPQFLSQCVLAGKNSLVHKIMIRLHHALRLYVQWDSLDDYLGLDLSEFYSPQSRPTLGASYQAVKQLPLDDDVVTKEMASSVTDKLSSVSVPQLSGQEQLQLADMVDAVCTVEGQRSALDENAARFLLYSRQLSPDRARTSQSPVSWREINWAYHSASQGILIDHISRQSHGNLLWEQAKESGLFMWLSDQAAMRRQFEIVSRNEYSKSEPKSPVDCSLFYLALRKKTVLLSLWRIANWNREQAATLRLLSNNFDEPKWRTVALKNAYGLLSRRRFQYAVSFFLLADHLQDALNVCVNQLGDMQLAIAIARIYDGDQGPILRKFLEDEVLPRAAREDNRWLASWAFCMLQRKQLAVRALIAPVHTLIEIPCGLPDMKAKSFLTDDPALLILYSQLRDQAPSSRRGEAAMTAREEWDFVLHNAKLYDRIGCDLLGLDLVRNWRFV